MLFDTYAELHTVQLGVLLGLFVGLIYRDYPPLAYALLFLGVFSGLYNASHIGFRPELDLATEIEAVPEYFVISVLIIAVINILLIEYWNPLVRRISSMWQIKHRLVEIDRDS